MSPALEVQALSVGYGAADVVRDLSLAVGEGECVAILGANGAGKTTLLRALSGLLVPRAGTITFLGQKPRRYDPVSIARLGVAHAPEGRGTIGGLTVEENLFAGAFLRTRKRDVQDEMERCFGYFPILRTYRSRPATSLSGGEQQMLALSRALMMNPRILLMDEPSFGLAPKVVQTVYDAVSKILKERELSVLVVEQSIELAERIADRAYLLKNGRVVAESDVRSLRETDTLRGAYFSQSAHD